MMSKKAFFRSTMAFLLLFAVSTHVGAQEISVEAARQAAASFLKSHAAKLPAKSRKGMMKAPPKAESLQLVYTQEDQLHKSPALYVFEQPKQGGYVIASADERAYPILGYNESGTFREDSLPCCLKFILEEYGRQIAEARKQNLPRHTEKAENESWQNIEPLITCAWDQGAPFNNLCPIDKNTGERCVTGCVATAMAQIMYYWKWPERGVGSCSYQTENVEGTLTANFGETTYRWDLMKDAYNYENGYDDPENAVATLMYHCGVALNMRYSSSGSGAGYIVKALKNYFNYSNAIYVISDPTFGGIPGNLENIIYEELLHKRPVEMSGLSHAYICDGYRTDGFFHFNLGWGPNRSNGYYKMNSVAGNWSMSATVRIAPKEEEIVDNNGNIYETLGGEAFLLKGGDVKGHLEIPIQVTLSNGTELPVVEISSNAFNGNTSITSVIIPNSVTSIGDGAFSGCSGLTSVTIGNSVTSIGTGAFRNCSGLTSINIPNSVTTIGSWAFRECSGLTSITIPNSVTSIGDGTFFGTGIYHSSADGVIYVDKWACGYKGTMPENTNIVLREGTLGIANMAFSGCSGLTSLTIGSSVRTIGFAAFRACPGLTNVTIPNSVTSIGNAAFSDCYGLTSVTIPNSVTSIEDYAFSGCSGLTSVTIPNSVTSIGNGAFEGCSELTSVTFHCKEIGPWFQGITTIKEIVLGEEVTSIEDYAFSDCSGLTSVTIPNSVTSIGYGAFERCSELTSVTFHCKEIGPWWFYGNTTIKEIIFGEEVTSIGDNAFKLCSSLTSVTIPNSVTSIGDAAFYHCSGLTSINIPNSVTSIGQSAFSGCSGLTSVTIPNSVTSIGDYAFYGCEGLTSVTFHCKEIGRWFRGITTIKEIVLGEEVKSIGESAFSGFSGLTSISIPNSVTSIGGEAFIGCTGLTSVTIPNSVTTIGERAFYGCEGLTSVTISNSVTSIQEWAFSGCPSLTSVTSCIENPFAIDKSVFLSSFWNRVFTDATLYVPIGTLEKYKSTDGWKNFKNIVEIEIDGIEGVYSDENNRETKTDNRWYSVDGVKLNGEPTKKGVYIVNGRKVVK